MYRLFQHEWKMNWKSLLIWLVCVSGMCLFCILLFDSIKESMDGMAEMMASMGAFASAFGMDRLSISTLEGFYATEVGTIHSLGGAMFAALLGSALLSKEEEGHTGEFLFSLPISRTKAVTAKWLALVCNIVLFNIISVLLYRLGIYILGEEIAEKRFWMYHLLQLVLHVQIGSICFCMSAYNRKNKIGVGLGITFFLYVWDLLARVVPALEDYLYLSPFAYANASDIFSTGEAEKIAVLAGGVVVVITYVVAVFVYNRKDLVV